MLKMKFNKKTIYIISIACLVFFIILVIYLGNIIGNENKSEIGKIELFAKGVLNPQGLVINKRGKLFAQSGIDGKISIINKDGTAMDYLYADDFYGYGIDKDYADNFIIATQKEIVVINNFGYLLRTVEGFESAYDVEVGPDNSVFVSDSSTNKIYRISPQKKVTVFAELGGKRSESVPNAAGISFDKDYKNLYAVSMYVGELYKIRMSKDYKAEKIDVIASNLKRPNFIDVDENGNVFVTCVGDNSIVRVNQNSIKEFIETKGRISNPSGIAVSSSNGIVLYVGSKDNNSIYKITVDSNIKTKK